MSEFQHPEAGYAFIVTYGRSGSTLLQHLVNAIPGCLIRGENNNALLGLFRSWRALTQSSDIARMKREGLVSDPTHPWFGAEAIDPDAYRAALCATFSQTILRPQPDTRIAGFKEIRTLPDPQMFHAFLDFLQTGFPGARLIFNTRDAADVCRSSWWRHHDPQEVHKMVASADAVFKAHTLARPDSAILLRYEDYTSDPQALEPLFELLGARPGRAELHAVMDRQLTHAT
ncbi:MAG: hypothetical protein EA339_04015 [Rhodobacteraceae bacterium]|nr:MAG: hypothetical protein EA339_04015 [Paracoccaceae bacterium]